MLRVATDAQTHDELRLDLDQLVREGARRLLAAALEAEVDDYLAAHAAERDEGGRRLVVRNGHARQRQVMSAAGAIPVRAPRVDDRRTDLVSGERVRFRSVILPPWSRKSPKVAKVLPLLYLHGLSTGDFAPALAGFFGSAAGLSAAAIGRLLGAWQADDQAFCQRDLAGRDDGYLWADGLTSGSAFSRPTGAVWCWWACAPTAPRNWSRSPTGSGSRLSRGRSCCGICVAAGCGRRWWRSATARCGGWAALRDVFPATRQQRNWVHKLANVLNALPNSVHAGARKALAEIRDAPDRGHAERAIGVFARDYGVKWPKAVAKITNDAEELLTFYDFPAEHWVHLRTSNPIESTFSTVRLRTRVTKGPGSKATGLAMAFKLLEAAQDR